jgi:hypothetical protein
MSGKIIQFKKPFNLRSFADQLEIRRLIKSAQRHGLVRFHKSKSEAQPPKHKYKQ